jgi:hypothetical protein
MSSVEIPRLRCTRCGHQWVPRQPKVWVCPKCHSPKWNEPKRPGLRKKGGPK